MIQRNRQWFVLALHLPRSRGPRAALACGPFTYLARWLRSERDVRRLEYEQIERNRFNGYFSILGRNHTAPSFRPAAFSNPASLPGAVSRCCAGVLRALAW